MRVRIYPSFNLYQNLSSKIIKEYTHGGEKEVGERVLNKNKKKT